MRVLSLGWLLRFLFCLGAFCGILFLFLVALIRCGMVSTLTPTLMNALQYQWWAFSTVQTSKYVRYDVHRPTVAECLVTVCDGDAFRVAVRKGLQTFSLSDG